MSLCETIRSNGQRCRAQALPDRPGCWAHDPGSREKADEARRRGGANRSNVARATRRMPRDMKELSGRILEAFDQVATGELAPDFGNWRSGSRRPSARRSSSYGCTTTIRPSGRWRG